mmetsp:Transcript_6087/g.18811  ORF Transcript_6087/g.18811 Transcript_6087/m.18811 type:complete len:535 (-) Transcript_6087:616-2220(-)
MAADRRRRVDRRNDLDALHTDELEVLVVVALMREQLLQERDELGRLVLVRPRQVDVLEVQNDARVVRRTQALACVGGHRLATHLHQLLDDIRRVGLRTAVDSRDLCAADAGQAVVQQRGLARALRADQDKRLAVLEPRRNQHQVLRDALRMHEHAGLLSAQLAQLVSKDGQRVRAISSCFKQAALPGHAAEVGDEVLARLRRHVGPEAARQRACKVVPRAGTHLQVGQRRVQQADLCRLHRSRVLQRPVQRLVQVVLAPRAHLLWVARGVRADPLGQHTVDVDGFVGEENHAAARNRCGRCKLQAVALEDEVDVVGELDAFAVWHRKQAVVVEHRVERFNPLGVHVAVADDPAALLQRLLHHLARGSRQHTVAPLARVQVHGAQQLLAVHRLGVHLVRHRLLANLLVSLLKHLPQGRLPAAARPDDDDADALLACQVQLPDLLQLLLRQVQAHRIGDLLDRLLQLGQHVVGDGHAREEVVEQVAETARVTKRERGQLGGAHRTHNEAHLRRGVERRGVGSLRLTGLAQLPARDA